ncbi:ATP-binding protein [uncultured Desulfosarcina sp.]|uniref:sensor histidine kinase n=1 Tax=uncultured Desulfosarcina sp. TaxID=218289 RepID=UPI0029C773FB|nr:ATP-binding protein [uncultured Desulfosarcina sp.]
MPSLPSNVSENSTYPDSAADHRYRYRRLFKRFVLLTLVCSVVPLLLVGWGISTQYHRFAETRLMTDFRNEVQHHRKVIEMFLKEHSSKLELIAMTHSRQDFIRSERLRFVFDKINQERWTLTDLGVIDATGKHLAYVGPYDLLDKNYREAHWFKMVMEKGLYISDMFMGFRREPHFVIAVRGDDDQGPWILRATVDTEAFRALVENVMIGRTGEVFLVNGEGIYQTTPRYSGRIMENASMAVGDVHPGIRVRQEDADAGFNGERSVRQIVSTAWLETPQWMLVVRQDFDEAFAAENRANLSVLIFLHVSAATILLVTVLVTRYMLNMVKRRDAEAEILNRQLVQASKMASIGELSVGVAHEINNPLAIISTEREILLDASKEADGIDPAFGAQLDDSMNQIDTQIKRCKRITHNLLRFSRRTQSVIDTVDINAYIREVVELMAREAKSSGITFFERLSPDVPPILSDPSQLQQVFLNLTTNAIDAHEGKQYGSVAVSSTFLDTEETVEIVVSDTGCGISEDNLSKVFDPFFTTKPMGRGTGLGLSICYSIIRRLGGQIQVKSVLNQGTDFTIRLPLRSTEVQTDPNNPVNQMERAA